MKKSLLTFCFSIVMLICYGQDYKNLRKAALAESDSGNFQKAILLSEKAISLAMKDKNINPVELLSIKSENAGLNLLGEHVEKGKSLFDNLLKDPLIVRYPEAEMIIRRDYGIGLSFLNDFQAAMFNLDKANELSKTYKMDEKDYINCLISLATCNQYLNKASRAEQLYKKAESLYIKEKMDNTIDFAYVEAALATFYNELKLPFKAKEYYEKADVIYIKTQDTLNPQYPVFLTEYGTMLANSGEFEKALKYANKAINLNRVMYGENSDQFATAVNNLGFIYAQMNKIAEAEMYYIRSLTLKKNLPFLRNENYLSSLNNIVLFLSNVGRDQQAKEFALELEDKMKKNTLMDTLDLGVFSRNLAIRYHDWGDSIKSIQYYKDALKFYLSIYGNEHPVIAGLYMDLATTYFTFGYYTESSGMLNKASDIYRKVPMRGDAQDITRICGLSMIMKELNKMDEANREINKAIELVKKLKTSDSEVLETVYFFKAQIAAGQNDVNTSMEYFNKYLDLKYSKLDQNFSYMTENEKMFFLDKFENNIKLFYGIIINNIDKYPGLAKTLIDFRLRTKAVLLNNLSKIKQQIANANDTLLTKKFEDLKLKRETVSKLMSFDVENYPNALSEASTMKNEADQLEKEISLKVSGYLGETNKENSGWKGIQKMLGAGEAAVEIFQCYQTENNRKYTNYCFLIIKPEGEPLAVSIKKPVSWENEMLQNYSKMVDQKIPGPELYLNLWKPADEKLTGYNTIYLSPDGIYNQLNLNTIYDSQHNKYVIEEKNLHLLTTLSDLKNIIKTTKRPINCVLVGNPKFDYDISKLNVKKNEQSESIATRSMYGFELSELPGTKDEVESIKTILNKNNIACTLLTEEKASESQIKKLKNPDVLHLATHGFFLKDLNDEDLTGYSKFEKDYYKNPMMRSGVFFSGANKNFTLSASNASSINEFEDGMLTSAEAMNLNLDKTELVVLSACQTGLGKIKSGEGVYGLQRAFKLAGVKSIIMSLWPVNDIATKELMINFYQNWIEKGNIYDAFRDAQLQLKKKYPEPYYWGAFVINGR